MAATKKSAAASFRKALTAKLAAIGHPVSSSVNDWPRVEITDVTESDVIDKGDDVREVGFIVEAISNMSYGEATAIIEDIEDALIGCETVEPSGWKVLEIYRELGTEINEVGDADLLIIRRRTQFRANIARNINPINI